MAGYKSILTHNFGRGRAVEYDVIIPLYRADLTQPWREQCGVAPAKPDTGQVTIGFG